MADKDFVVKNGLVVNTNLIVANGDSNRVGINNSSPDASLTVTGTANVSGNVTLSGQTLTVSSNTNISGNTNFTGTNNWFSSAAYVGANVALSTTQLVIGNSTVNTSVNSTVFSGTANNATNLGGAPASAYVNTSGNYTVAGNLNFTGANNRFGTGLSVGANVVLSTTQLTVGNSTVNASVNSTVFSGTANNADNLGTAPASAYVNTSGNYTVAGNLNFTGTNTNFASALFVGANVALSTGQLTIGNSTVNVSVNSTVFSGTANNATNLGGAPSTSYVNTTGSYTVAGNLNFTGANTGFGSGLFVGSNVTLSTSQLRIGNSTVNVSVNSTVFSGTANNADNLGTAPASAYVNTSGNYTVAGNLNFTGANNYFSAAVRVGDNVTVNTTQLTIGNSTINASVNSTVYSGTANNATNLGGAAASAYVNTSGNYTVAGNLNFTGANTGFGSGLFVGANVTLSTTQLRIGNSTVNVSVNSTTFSGTANNADNLGGVAPSSYVNTSGSYTVAGNLNFTGTNTYFGSVVRVGDNVTVNTTQLTIGNSTVNASVNSTVYSGTANNATNLAGAPSTAYVNTTGNYTVAGNLNFTGANNRFGTGLTVGANVSLTTTQLIIGNSSVNASVNSTVYSGTANNTSFVGAVSAANVVSNAQLSANLSNYQTTAGLSANVATLTSNNATNFAGQPQSYYTNATNLSSGTVGAARLSGQYTGVTQVGTLGSLSVTGNGSVAGILSVTTNATTNSVVLNNNTTLNVDAGVLYVDPTNNRVGINTLTPTEALTVVGVANVTGNLVVGGDLIITGNTTTAGTQEITGDIVPSSNGYKLGNTSSRWDLFGVDGNFSGNVNISTAWSVGGGNLNVASNGSALIIGNSTVNTTVNSTAFTGTANNATNFAGQPQSYYTNATNLSSGTVDAARLPQGNSTTIGALQIIDSVTNTSTSIAASANSVKNAYDRAIDANTRAASAQSAAISAYTNATTIAANATNLTSGTVNAARLPTGNSTTIGGLQIVDSVSNTSTTITATANNVKTAYDAAIAANTRAASAQTAASDASSAAAAANTRAASAQTAASDAYTNATTFAANADNITSGTVNAARLPTGNSTVRGALQIVDSVSNTSTTIAATANSVKTAYDTATAAQTAAGTAYTNAITIAANATNLTSGTVNAARLPTGNSTAIGALQIVDSVSNTSITITATANNVKTAYDAAIAANTRAASAQTAASDAYTNAVSYASNATNLSSGTVNAARLPTGNSTTIGALQIIDSVVNTSITIAVSANSVKTAYDTAIAANTRAASAQTAASDAYTNATAFSANATNITSGTVNAARLPLGNSTVRGALIVLDSVTNTSITDYAPSANSVKTAYDAAIAANTRAASAQTAASDAYTNATTFSANASNLGNGTVPSARISGAYTGITQVGTLAGIAASGNANFDSGVLFVDGTNNRVGVNTSTPSVSLQIASNDAVFVPIGNTTQRPTGSNGMFRYNTDTGSFEGFANGAWGNIAGGGGSAGGYYKGNAGAVGNTDNKGNLYRINSNTQSNNVTIAAGENALTVGPMVIASGFNLTIQEGGRAVII